MISPSFGALLTPRSRESPSAVREPGNDMGLVWLLIDATFPLLMASIGIRLLREASAQSGSQRATARGD